MTGPGIYPQTYHTMLCPACMSVRESNKQQKRGSTISKDFFISYDNDVLLVVFSQCDPPSCTLQKRPSSPLQFGQEENITGHPTGRRAYWFVLKIAGMFSVPQSRIGIGS